MTFLHNDEHLDELGGERLAVGEVRDVLEVLTVDRQNRTYIRREVIVGDESDADPGLREWYHRRTDTFERQLRLHPEWRPTARNEHGGIDIDPDNEPAVDLYYTPDGKSTQMLQWAGQMKEAIALEGLQNLSKGGRFLPGGALDDRTLELFTNMTDGIGLRSRQHIYAELIQGLADRSYDDTLRIVSLGSGAAVPNIEATKAVEALGKRIEWNLFDLDPRALGSAEEMIADAGLTRSTFDFGPRAPKGSPTKYAGRSYLAVREEAQGVEDNSLDAVDALGLWEYLNDRQAATFLKVNYKKLKRGAPMIVSNMYIDRPHAKYNQYAVGWPDLYMRDEEDLLNIVEKANLTTDQVRITIPKDRVYMVMEIYKQ